MMKKEDNKKISEWAHIDQDRQLKENWVNL